MEHNHTPGPWFAVEYSGYHNLHDSDRYGATNILDEEECARAEHNAKLASSAPELLDALQTLVESLDSQGVTYTKDVHVVINKSVLESIKEAIKKATE